MWKRMSHLLIECVGWAATAVFVGRTSSPALVLRSVQMLGALLCSRYGVLSNDRRSSWPTCWFLSGRLDLSASPAQRALSRLPQAHQALRWLLPPVRPST